ncbi:MAG: hypothetical protein ACD_57C00401G0007 [uncultured bacterium]|uniref:DUF2795 domain-containing protein n=1 Tax=Candidatus Curtissbacteria bacterium RIFOXYA1_FULL_41_14 TaxID=1797737 RepID=A0A1F5HCT5_9BACT|nr:MAG: hypothetical protein ACD_57C00401G0007 [uncultured bacterium]KKR55851.1 MAG: hypothetical protein UT95_C0062G0009 [Candidatus Curtissbacteria bacterium GW2011_GWB1_40_28]KKR75721.1 MAG: hypothetical protein UU19_C0049G0003 [Candidatus Curtissbacteria bacterium GW2011_GWD1_40_8]KKS00861.1 MAG: hypothetical protein UU53_C0026G0024 [Candidatus Curtissbacteria bacterium GW2011_GWC2_41_21]OGD81317.1 MAG: hypothetical protein A2683_01235 [Candidatus Curtissbacteria bacterium RIFCSPHIGHO2_01_F
MIKSYFREGGEKVSNKKGAISHLKDHQMYPATRDDLIAECNGLSDFSKEDKMWFEEHLPEGNYASANQVISALGL